METGTLWRLGRRGACARSNGVRGSDVAWPEPAAHAELAANSVVECASGGAL